MAAIVTVAPAKEAAKAAKPAPKEQPRRVKFNIGNRYLVQDVIGEGAYGVVASATHKETGVRVAIKKIAPFEHSSAFASLASLTHTVFCLRTLRELKLLRYFQENAVSENIISCVDIIKPKSLDSFTEVYVIQELMETDMHRVIRTQDLSEDHCQYFIYQAGAGCENIAHLRRRCAP